MRKAIILLALMALMVALSATVALAVNKQCGTRPCYGTSNDDVLYERGGDGVGDTIYGLAGDDRINATSFTNDRDILYGGRGNDKLNAMDGDTLDTVYGGAGFDVCRVDAVSEVGRGCDRVILPTT